MRSGRGLTVLLVLAGGLVAVLAGGRAWLTVATSAAAGLEPVAVTGRDAAPGGVALGLVAAAGAVVLATSGHGVRRAVAALLACCGLGLVAVTVAFRAGEHDVVVRAIAEATGLRTAGGDGYSAGTIWPWVSALGGVLVLAGAGIALARAARWDRPSRRFEPPGPPAGAASAGTGRAGALEAWDALSAGVDPTDDAPPP